MSPILVRPVREQLEHDRVIRLLQVKLKRKHDVVANIGEDQTVPVRIGQVQIFPDLVLTSVDRGKKLMGTVEVETAESVNHLEAMAQWAHLGRARAPFHLYVPGRLRRHRPAPGVRKRRQRRGDLELPHDRRPDPLHPGTPGAGLRVAPGSATREPAKRPHVEPAGGRQIARRGGAHAQGAAARPPRKPPGPSAARPRSRRPRAAKKEVSPAHASVQPRQARLREHLRRPHAAPPEHGSFANPLLVPDSARGSRRARGASTRTRFA